MKFEWHETKNEQNIAKHVLDFHYAISVFLDDERLESEDNRKDYGEKRYIVIGKIEELIYTVVYTRRGKNYRIISARGANRNEKQYYYRHANKNEQA